MIAGYLHSESEFLYAHPGNLPIHYPGVLARAVREKTVHSD